MQPQPKTFFPTIRPTVRAVIVRNGELLVQVKEKPGQPPYLTLPGGKQEPGETAIEALVRECTEEVGAEVTVGPLIHVAEVFRPKDEGLQHQLELLFSCEVPEDYVPVMGPHPDPSQTGTIWASPVDRASAFRPAYATALSSNAPLYLGVLNG
ncbi:NUDIX domain-containing protein [uncultured Roseibium sp.]|uniref:NUDIX domain-containing protein n=1 Tax=uncultured Roseibium sp. TaxID=1936171 RepID=UPI003217C61C